MLKNLLATTVTELSKLLLSNVLNLVDSIMYSNLQHSFSNQTREDFDQSNVFNDITLGLDIPTLRLRNDMLNNCDDVETLLPQKNTAIGRLLEQKKENQMDITCCQHSVDN